MQDKLFARQIPPTPAILSELRKNSKEKKNEGVEKKQSKLPHRIHEGVSQPMTKKIIVLSLMILLIITGIANADWTTWKKKQGIQDYSGAIGLRYLHSKPPDYELSYKVADKYIALNRFLLKKKGWFKEEDEESLYQDEETKEQGGWAIEYGTAGVSSETQLFEAESVYGWKVTLGERTEILWGQAQYGEQKASAVFNAGKFYLTVFKSTGIVEPKDNFFFDYIDPTKPNPNFTKKSSRPVTKREGGAIRIPFEFRESRGEFEFAGQKRFDEELNKDVNGIAFAANLSSPRFYIAFRNIGEGFESEIRTTDINILAPIYKHKNTAVKAGFGTMDFSGAQKSRYSIKTEIEQGIANIRTTLVIDANKQGEEIGISVTGSASGKYKNTSISLRRTERIQGFTRSHTNSIRVSRKEGQLSATYGVSTTKTTTTTNTQLNGSVNISDEIKLGAGLTQNTTKQKDKEVVSTSYSCLAQLGRTSINAQISKNTQTYTIARELNLEEITAGRALSVSVALTKNKDGNKITGGITYSW